MMVGKRTANLLAKIRIGETEQIVLLEASKLFRCCGTFEAAVLILTELHYEFMGRW